MPEKRGFPSLTNLYLQMDKLSAELDRIGENGRKHDDILQDIRKRHMKREWARQAIEADSVVNRGPLVVILLTLGLIAFASFAGPTITGYATALTPQPTVQYVSHRMAQTPVTSTFTFITIALATVGLASLFFGRVERKDRSKHDKYKHPAMLEK